MRRQYRPTPSMTADRYAGSAIEDEMTDGIDELVRTMGGRLFHVRRSDRSPEMVDFPDTVIVVPRVELLVLAELKSQDRHVTGGQRIVMEQLGQCNRFWTGIVRPDPREGEISYDDFLSLLSGNTP